MDDLLEVSGLSTAGTGAAGSIRGVSFVVPPGSIVGLVGSRGSGRSTLIDAVLDLVPTELQGSGRIRVLGASHTSTAARTALLYLGSVEHLPHYLTPREILDVLGRLHGAVADHELALEYLQAFATGRGTYDSVVAQLSLDARWRVQLVLALVLRRPITVIDETLDGLHAADLRVAERELRGLVAEGRSVLLCSDDLDLLERLTDSVLLLDDGELVGHAVTDRVVREYGSLASMVSDRLAPDDLTS